MRDPIWMNIICVPLLSHIMCNSGITVIRCCIQLTWISWSRSTWYRMWYIPTRILMRMEIANRVARTVTVDLQSANDIDTLGDHQQLQHRGRQHHSLSFSSSSLLSASKSSSHIMHLRLDSCQNIRLHTGARENVVLFTYLLTYLLT